MAKKIVNLSLIEVLKGLFLKDSAKIGIFILRGGLGNQLFQLSALAYYAKKIGFIPVIYTRYLGQNTGDGKRPAFESLNAERFFSCDNKLRKASGLVRLAITLHIALLRRSNPNFAVKGMEIEQKLSKVFGHIFYIRGYFENKVYPENLKSTELLGLLDVPSKINPLMNKANHSNQILIHLRFTDSLTPSDSRRNIFDYSKLLTELQKKHEFLLVDCFSDDIKKAKNFLAPIQNRFKINFPESNYKLKSPQLLDVISQYKNIISSDSTLIWWACFIASNRKEKDVIIYSGFPKTLHLNDWKVW